MATAEVLGGSVGEASSSGGVDGASAAWDTVIGCGRGRGVRGGDMGRQARLALRASRGGPSVGTWSWCGGAGASGWRAQVGRGGSGGGVAGVSVTHDVNGW